MIPYFLAVCKSLIEKYKVKFANEAAPAFKETVRAVCNSNNWISANQLCTRSALMSG